MFVCVEYIEIFQSTLWMEDERMFESWSGLESCMSGNDFELFIQRLLTRYGFNATLTGNNDNGVDIIATLKEGDCESKYYIQCKFYNRTVGKLPVQEVFSGSHYFGNDGHPVVITNNYMASGTKMFANGLNVEVITGYQLKELLNVETTKEKRYKGLLGILFRKAMGKDANTQNSVESCGERQVTNREILDRKALEKEITEVFDQANIILQEASELQMKVFARQQQALLLQKEGLLKNLNCL